MNRFKLIQSLFIITILAMLAVSCSEDDETNGIIDDPFVVAFENLSANLSEIEGSKEIALVYSEVTNQPGSVTLLVEATNAVYGTDFTTNPPVESGNITLPIAQSESGSAITFTKINPALDETVEINFTIVNIAYPNAQIQGNSTFALNNSASLGRGFEPTVGGPNQPNQVYIDLSTEQQTIVQRDTWDLGFYGGNDFRVGINGSIYMATAALDATDIDAVTQADVAALQDQVAVGTFDPANEAYIDHPDGAITKTAINAVSANDADNKVYLVNLGYEVGTETPTAGSVAVAGAARGWKKIRVLREGDGYLLQYANLEASNHLEVRIHKNSDFNFTFFSFDTQEVATVEPPAESWDICFTVFTNLLDGAGSYGFSDGVLHNRKGGVTAYPVSTEDIPYDVFSLTHVNNGAFQQDQRAIGSTWREVISEDKSLVDTIYYIIQDPNGNIYKLKFTALLSDTGVRGFPEFKYNLLQ